MPGAWPGARSTTSRGVAPPRLRRPACDGGVQAGRVVGTSGAAVGTARRGGRAGPSARCARPTAGTGRARRGSRTSAHGDRLEVHGAASLELEVARSTVPSSSRSPGVQRDARPLATHVAPVDPRRRWSSPGRATIQPSAGRPHLGVVARDVGVVEHDVAVAAAAERRAAGADGERLPLGDTQHRAAAARAARARRRRLRARSAVE